MDYFHSDHAIGDEIKSSSVETSNPEALMADVSVSDVGTEPQRGGANFRYTAYGKLIQITQGLTAFQFGWVGLLGRRDTNLAKLEQYVRARDRTRIARVLGKALAITLAVLQWRDRSRHRQYLKEGNQGIGPTAQSIVIRTNVLGV